MDKQQAQQTFDFSHAEAKQYDPDFYLEDSSLPWLQRMWGKVKNLT